MSRTTGFPSSFRTTAVGGGSRLGVDFTVLSTKFFPLTRTPDNTFANSTAVFANADYFRSALRAIEQQLTALGG